MLCHYDYTIVSDMNSSITYNDECSLLLIDNLDMPYAKTKEIICHGFG